MTWTAFDDKTGLYRIRFRHGGRKCNLFKTLKITTGWDAEAKRVVVERTIALLEQGVITVARSWSYRRDALSRRTNTTAPRGGSNRISSRRASCGRIARTSAAPCTRTARHGWSARPPRVTAL